MDIKNSSIKAFLNPKSGNPRNSEGSFIRLEDNRIAFAYSRFYGKSGDDHAPSNICVIYSSDDGDNWGIDNIETLIDASDYGETNAMSVTLLRFYNGDIGCFYVIKHLNGLRDSVYLRRYSSDFNNLIEEVRCLPDNYPGYYVLNNDRILLLSNGNLIMPTSRHPSAILPEMKNPIWLNLHGEAVFFTSLDDGHTWRQNTMTLNINDSYSRSGLQEPGLIELSGGVIYSYFRTDRMYQYESVSLDGGEHWFAPQPSRFNSPASPMLIKKNPYNGKFYAVWNPIPEYTLRPKSSVWTGGRTPFVIAESDNGLNFSAPVIIEDDPQHGFCYPAIYFLDENTFLISYCSGGSEEGGCLFRTTIRKICI